MFHLVFLRRGLELMRAPLAREVVTVGRGGRADIVLPEPGIAPIQLELAWDGAHWMLTDRSGHGTIVGGKSRMDAMLDVGFEISLGECQAQLVNSVEDPAADRARARTLAEGPELEALPDELWVLARLPGDPGPPRRVPFFDALEIGSAEGAGLRLQGPLISAWHARLSRQKGRLVLQDRQSLNGTWYQGGFAFEVGLPLDGWFRVGPWDLWVEGAPQAGRPPLEDFEGIVSQMPAMRHLFGEIAQVADSDVSVVIHGETGSGKELVARAIHRRSPRAKGPFIAVNCGGLNQALAHSALFGHEKGAFTGAIASTRGAFLLADGGTLFLDETAELTPELQTKLLRALETREIQPLGSEAVQKVNVRIVGASHRSLLDEMLAGRFRKDLYYRLAVTKLELPPLRDRLGDVPHLWQRFMEELRPGSEPRLTAAAADKLLRHPWPGNVRELRNVALRALWKQKE
ncbi:MAG: sigma 54-interacting transcriptional regulator, partial [Deltaproteobacteria bacterium]